MNIDYYENFKNNFNLNDKFYSRDWSLGGNRKNCWGDSYVIDADDEPEKSYDYFYELEQLLNKIYSHMDDSLKEKILEEYVYIDYDRGESDWYGGTEYKAAFYCDIQELYDLLDTKGIITIAMLMKGEY